MLKNLYEATKFNYDSHDCILNLRRLLGKGWQAKFEGYKVSLVELLHHICLTGSEQILPVMVK